MVWYVTVWFGMLWSALVWGPCGIVRYCTVRYGTARHGTVRYRISCVAVHGSTQFISVHNRTAAVALISGTCVDNLFQNCTVFFCDHYSDFVLMFSRSARV